MSIISIDNLTKSYGEKVLFDNISFKVNEGDKIGIIGVNGTGKTSLLNIIAGLDYPDNGSIESAKNFHIEYLMQAPDFEETNTVLEQIFKGNSPILNLIRDYENTLDEIENDKDSKELQKKLLNLTDSITKMNGWEYESKVKTILTKLGIKNFNMKMGNLSGGQRKRVALAGALITDCDLLILDEPTNHMDNETIAWLEEFLNSRKGALLMITHDRYFLDRVVNKTLELDNGKLYTYSGNYTEFLEKKSMRKDLENTLERKRASLYKKELEWIRTGAKARTTKQKARIQRFDDIKNTSYASAEESVDISVAHSRLGKKIIEIDDISKAYDDYVLFSDFTYVLQRDDRIGIVGKNGAGKSTLLGVITKRIPCDKGTVDIGDTVNISYFTQESVEMDQNLRAIDYIKEGSEFITTKDGTKISASQMMERFLFSSNMQYTYISKLSGGEKRRLYLLRILMTSPNVLILDEPTNDLDIDTLKVLEDYIDEFSGAVIAVSHDRYFLDRICNKIFSLDHKPGIYTSIGNYSDYVEHAKEMITESDAKEKNKIKPVDKEKKKSEVVKFTYSEKLEFEKIYDEIEFLENKIEQVDIDMTACATDFVKLSELSADKDALEEQLLVKMERLEYLEEKNEQIINQK